MFLYILIFIFFDSRLEDKRLCTEWQQTFPDFSLLLISSCMGFWYVRVISKHTNYSTLSKTLLPLLTLCVCPALQLRYMLMYLVFSAFASRPISLPATNKAYGHRLTINLPVLWCSTAEPRNIPHTDLIFFRAITICLQYWKKILWLQMWRWSLGLHSCDMTADNTSHDLVINRG
jgi:hypothetical protein